MFQVFVKQALTLLQIFLSANWDTYSRFFFSQLWFKDTWAFFHIHQHWKYHNDTSISYLYCSSVTFSFHFSTFQGNDSPIIILISNLKYDNCDVLFYFIFAKILLIELYWQSEVFMMLVKIHTQKKDIQTWHADNQCITITSSLQNFSMKTRTKKAPFYP